MTVEGRGDANKLDWGRVLRIARRHRVEGLVHAGLARLGVSPPDDFAEALRADAGRIAREAVVLAGETVRLQRRLDACGIRNVALKGASLEALGYGGLGLRMAKDVDLLVTPADADAARQALQAMGYAAVHPKDLDEEQWGTWIRLGRDVALVHPERGVEVELHWRLVDSPILIPAVSVESATVEVALAGGATVRTLAPQELFAYLCVHGASHGWSRLKWLCDIAALAARADEPGLERLHGEAVAHGAGLCALQALALCERLEMLRLPPELARAARRPLVRWLVEGALRTLTAGGGEVELEDQPFGSSWITLSQPMLSGDLWKAPHEVLYRLMRGPDLHLYVTIPARLRIFYPWLRAAQWFRRRIHPTHRDSPT